VFDLDMMVVPSVLSVIGFVCYESIKRGLNRRLIYEYQCDEN
jgi:hypothetical protein